ncbi:hypothetical protein [Candidatus Electronema sp. PJ]|uniref:hypothetical protein n=1 Tax=Candidatus Electronema sp. PJ TaxID=3401572 RepID=UPI003AA9CC74
MPKGSGHFTRPFCGSESSVRRLNCHDSRFNRLGLRFKQSDSLFNRLGSPFNQGNCSMNHLDLRFKQDD